jgi:hypothetical protein
MFFWCFFVCLFVCLFVCSVCVCVCVCVCMCVRRFCKAYTGLPASSFFSLQLQNFMLLTKHLYIFSNFLGSYLDLHLIHVWLLCGFQACSRSNSYDPQNFTSIHTCWKFQMKKFEFHAQTLIRFIKKVPGELQVRFWNSRTWKIKTPLEFFI